MRELPPKSIGDGHQRKLRFPAIDAAMKLSGDGYPPHFASEWVFDQGLKQLPSLLQALREGRKPDQVALHTLGSVATDWTALSEQATQQIEQDRSKAVAEFYTGYIKSVLPIS